MALAPFRAAEAREAGGAISSMIARSLLPVRQLLRRLRVVEWPPRPSWKPSVPVDIDRTVNALAYYLDQKKPFIVFRHGTCVAVSPTSSSPELEAKQVLHDIIHAHVDMKPLLMDDDNWTVSYSGPAYSVVFADEIIANWEYIDANHLTGLAKDEVLLNAQGEGNRFDRSGKIGLFGRARMFMDALEPRVLRLCHSSARDA
jgi:hypothetical protein